MPTVAFAPALTRHVACQGGASFVSHGEGLPQTDACHLVLLFALLDA